MQMKEAEQLSFGEKVNYGEREDVRVRRLIN
jgi:hypothetical protein